MARKLKILIKLYLFLINTYSLEPLFSQSILPIKEEFDLYNYGILYNIPPPYQSYSPCTISPNADQDILGDGMSFVLESYLEMYLTTLDKGYLYKFILQSLCMIENRHDFAGINSEPRWSENMYQDGYIIASFAKFVHFIKLEEPTLFNQSLYPFSEFSNNSFNQNFQTFGQYANWLQDRCGETLWWYITNGYWSEDWGMLDIAGTNSTGASINMQVGFGKAFLFIGKTAGEQGFINKARIISQLYKSRVIFFDLCEGQFYNNDVLRLTTNNAYWWYHSGWRRDERDCFQQTLTFDKYQKYSGFVEYVEDISHGAIVTYLAYDFFKFQSSSDFNINDMVRFRNMFAKNIYDGANGFNESVKGAGENVFPLSELDISALNYINFADYDGYDATATGPNVYDMIMDYYSNFITGASNLPSSYGGQANKGHAELVREQWERECVNLTLYNRDVVYDQDFFVKNILTIDPNGGNGISYAEPTIHTPEFRVNDNITSNISAGEYISLKPGTQFLSGSNVSLKINPSLCTDGQIVGEEENRIVITNQEQNVNLLNEKEEKIELKAFPNPSNNSTTLSFVLQQPSIISLAIYDNNGNPVFNELQNRNMEEGLYKIPISLENFNTGIYYCILTINNSAIATVKLIRTK